jgi:8-oxo-dGTP pyrophosphatase MutT (NUDIX family)
MFRNMIADRFHARISPTENSLAAFSMHPAIDQILLLDGCVQCGLMSLELFSKSLSVSELGFLKTLTEQAIEPAPNDLLRLFMGQSPVGCLSQAHANALINCLSDMRIANGCLYWNGHLMGAQQRTEVLGIAAEALRGQGLITGWRNECYSFWGDIGGEPDPHMPEWFRLERAAFRFFGLRSHAVHINGFTPDGRMWCARRALTKATDPGRLDNLAAGGLPVGERLLECAQRELHEEAGVQLSFSNHLTHVGQVTTARMEPQGWHHETLWVYNLTVSEGFLPQNTDGEVSEFMCLTPPEVMERIRCDDYSKDAACVIATAVLSSQYFSGTIISGGTGDRM